MKRCKRLMVLGSLLSVLTMLSPPVMAQQSPPKKPVTQAPAGSHSGAGSPMSVVVLRCYDFPSHIPRRKTGYRSVRIQDGRSHLSFTRTVPGRHQIDRHAWGLGHSVALLPQ